MAIYKRGGEFKLGTTEHKSSKWPERDSNPGPPDCESSSLRSNDGDGNGNATNAIGLITKTTILHHHAFLFISLPSLHDYDVKMLNFTLYRGSTQATTKFPPSF